MKSARLALLGTVIVGSALLAQQSGQPAKPAKPSKEQIARWVAQLGADDFNAREEASRLLWEASVAAEPALEAAVKGGDAEVGRRAGEILDKFKWGLYPSTPKELAALITRYQQAEGDGKAEVVREMLDAGTPGCKALLRIVTAESVPDNQKAVRNQLAADLSRALPRLLEQKELALLDDLLAAGMEVDEQLGLRNAAACWLLTDQIDRKIEQTTVRAEGKEKPWRTDLLVYLHRARGDLAAARDAARRAGREDLVNAMLYEAGDWKEESWPTGAIGVGRDIEKLGYRAACRRLAGQQKEFEAALAEIRQSAEKVPDDNPDGLLPLARALLLNHQTNEALVLLARSERRPQDLFKMLCKQYRYNEALALLDKLRAAKPKDPHLELRQAELLGKLGEKDKARAVFARYAAPIKPEGQVSWAAQLIEAEVAVGFRDDAFKHAVELLTAGPSTSGDFLQHLFHLRGDTVQVLWDSFSRLFPREEVGDRMNRLRLLLEGRASKQELTALIDNAGRPIGLEKNPMSGGGWQALALAALACRHEDLAQKCLEKVGTPQALLLQGDLLACNKKWDEAARLYFQVWDKDRNALALYLSGKALLHAGQRPEGTRRIELARLLPGGNEGERFTLAFGLAQRGDRRGALREFELLFRLSTPGSYLAMHAMHRVALYADQLRDGLRAADYHERALLRALSGDTAFLTPLSYVQLPGFICAERAQGLLAGGKVNEALAVLARGEEIWPGFQTLAIEAVPQLERLGRKKEADELFARTIEQHQKVLRQFPRCADAHDAIAWVSAGCRRNLDAALDHAQKAVELEPEKVGHLDSLAEVCFQRGDRAQAVALQKKVVQREPHFTVYRLRLKRFEAGDPKTPLVSPLIAGDSAGQPLPFVEDEGD